MSKIGEISLNISNKLGEKLNKNEEEIAVINYGLFMIIHTSMSVICTLIMGIITNMLVEVMTISIIAAIMKRYTGGVHATSPERCLIVGLILTMIMSVIGVNISKLNENVILSIVLLIVIVAFYYIHKKCPVPSPNKPLKNIEKRMILKRKSLKLMILYSIFLLSFYCMYKINNNQMYLNLVVYISMGINLQVFSISKFGESIVLYLDGLLKKIKI